MFSRLFLLACLVAGTVAESVKCLNGGKPMIGGGEFRPCDCGPDYTGRYCGIPRKNFVSHVVTKTNFETFTFEDIRSSNLTEEPAYSSHFYWVYLEFQSEDGSPIELLVEHLDPLYEQWCAKGMNEALAGTVKLNGKGYGCSDLYHKVHRSNEGKFVLEVFLINGSDRYNMTVMAKKPLSDPYNKCKNGGSNLSLSSTTDQSTDNVPCTCPPDFTGSLCETPIDIFKVIKVDSPVQKVHASVSKLYKNTKLPRLAQFLFLSPNGKNVEVTIDRFPSEYDCDERASGNYFTALSKDLLVGYCAKYEPGTRYNYKTFVGKKVSLSVLFNYENNADEKGFVSGEEQFQNFEFTVRELERL